MFVVLIFGFLGWLMVQFAWQRPPLLLGLVLGPLMENRLFLATDNYGVAWLWRPGVIVLFLVTLFGVFYPVLKRRRAQAAGVSERASAQELRPIPQSAAFFTLGLVAVLAWALWESRNFGFRAGLFPWTIGTPILILAVFQLMRDILGKTQITGIEGDRETGLAPDVLRRRTAGIIGWILGFCAAIWLLGFSLAAPVATFVYLKTTGREKWPIALMLAALAAALFYGFFQNTLKIPFPQGQLFTWIE